MKQFLFSLVYVLYSNNSMISLSMVNEDNISIAKGYLVELNYPNPFNPSTTIRYQIPASLFPSEESSSVHVTLKVYDVLGREVTTLVDEIKEPSYYTSSFSALRSSLSSGLYIYRIICGNYSESKKMLLIK